MKKWQYLTSTALLGSAIVLGACGGEENNDETATSAQTTEQAEAGGAQLTGNVVGDGSSTVAPITEALVEEYAGYKKMYASQLVYLVQAAVSKNSSMVKQISQTLLVQSKIMKWKS